MKINKEKIYYFVLWLIPVLGILFVFRDVFLKQGIIYDGDTILSFWQYLNYFANYQGFVSYHILGGFPLYISVTGVWFYPVNKVLLLIWDSFDVYRYLIVINFFLAYLFSYLFFRKIRLTRFAAIVGSTLFLFSGHNIIWGSTLANTNYYFLLPFVLWLIETGMQKFTQSYRHRYLYVFTVFSGVVAGMGWLSGHIQLVAYINILAVVYLLFRIVWEYRNKFGSIWNWKNVNLKKMLAVSFGLVVVFGVVSFIVGLPQIKPILEFREYTARSGGVSLSDFWISAYTPFALIYYLLPNLDLPFIDIGLSNFYVGILGILVLVWSVFNYGKIKDNVYFKFFFWIWVFCWLVAFKYSPLGVIFHYLPFLNVFREIPRIMFVGGFAQSAVIAYTFQYLVERDEVVMGKIAKTAEWLLKVFAVLAVVVTAVYMFFKDAILKILQDIFINKIYISGRFNFSVEHYLNIIEDYVEKMLRYFSLYSNDILALILFGFLSIWFLKSLPKFNQKRKYLFAVFLITANFVFVFWNRYEVIGKDVFYRVPESVKYLQSRNDNRFRVFSLFPGITSYNKLNIGCNKATAYDFAEFHKSMLTPNINIMYDLQTIDGYDNYMTKRVSQMIAYIGAEQAPYGDRLAYMDKDFSERIAEFLNRINIVKSLNVKYIISSYHLEDKNLEKVFQDSVTSCNVDIYIYKLQGAWPRYFLTNNVEVQEKVDFDYVVKKIQSKDTPYVIVEGRLPDSFKADSQGSYKEVVPISESDEIKFNLSLERDSFMFVGVSNIPGWKAYIDGKETEIFYANYMFMGVLVPKGEHDIMFKYSKL